MTDHADVPPLTEAERSPWYPLELAVAREWLESSVAERHSDLTPGRTDAEVPAAAVDALGRGAAGSELDVLAGMTGATWSQLRPQVERVYQERGVARPTGDRAARLVADAVLRCTVDATGDCRAEAETLFGLWAYGPTCLEDALARGRGLLG